MIRFCIRRGFPHLRSLRRGFTLLEIVPVLAIAVFLLTIVILALNPAKQYQEARNVHRKHDIALIADAIVSYTRDYNSSLMLKIPTGSAVEICGDTSTTRNCTGLLDLNILHGTYLNGIPRDPSLEDGVGNTRYFAIRSGSRVTISALDTEPEGTDDLTVTR